MIKDIEQAVRKVWNAYKHEILEQEGESWLFNFDEHTLDFHDYHDTGLVCDIYLAPGNQSNWGNKLTTMTLKELDDKN
jgi:hypothetical protein